MQTLGYAALVVSFAASALLFSSAARDYQLFIFYFFFSLLKFYFVIYFSILRRGRSGETAVTEDVKRDEQTSPTHASSCLGLELVGSRKWHLFR